jgi:hypothetical protein
LKHEGPIKAMHQFVLAPRRTFAVDMGRDFLDRIIVTGVAMLVPCWFIISTFFAFDVVVGSHCTWMYTSIPSLNPRVARKCNGLVGQSFSGPKIGGHGIVGQLCTRPLALSSIDVSRPMKSRPMKIQGDQTCSRDGASLCGHASMMWSVSSR